MADPHTAYLVPCPRTATLRAAPSTTTAGRPHDHQAVPGRRGIGAELKPSYFSVAVKNLAKAVKPKATQEALPDLGATQQQQHFELLPETVSDPACAGGEERLG